MAYQSEAALEQQFIEQLNKQEFCFTNLRGGEPFHCISPIFCMKSVRCSSPDNFTYRAKSAIIAIVNLREYLVIDTSFILLEVINDLLLFTHPTVEQMEQFYYLFLLRIRGGSRNKCISDIALANR